MDNINYKDFKNMCRTCLINYELKSIQQNDIIIEVLNNLTGVPFETNDELPQQICINCFDKIQEIHEFSSRCKQTYSNLMECLNNYKNQTDELINNIKEETNESIKIKEEIINDEPKIEFVQVDDFNAIKDDEVKIKQEITEDDDNKINEQDVLKENPSKNSNDENPNFNEFYTDISDETKALAFLRKHGLLDDEKSVLPCHRCGGVMRDARKRRRNGEFMPVLRCRNRGCQTYRSVRRGNVFFHFTDLNNKLNCKLSLCQILELIFYFIQDLSYDLVQSLTGRGTETICNWFNMCREVCKVIVSVQNRGQMIGTEDDPVFIDEARFVGRRKPKKTSSDHVTDSETSADNNRNLDDRLNGPWVFGLKRGSDCRYFYVQKRDRETLISIIQREVSEGSFIYSDDCLMYSNLNEINYRHFSIGSKSGSHSQEIERSWFDAKIRILKKMRGCNQRTFQSHLDYFCWRMMRKDAPDLYLAFLADVRAVYR